MTPPPLVCPQPGPRNPGPDCPFVSAAERIRFERQIEADAAARLGLSALVSADLGQGSQKPSPSPTRPDMPAPSEVAALPSPSPEFNPLSPKKGVRRA